MITRSWILWLALLALAGCSRHAAAMPTLTVALQPAERPPQLGTAPSAIEFTIADAGQPVTNATVTVEGTMTHAGMPPASAVATEIAPGRYQAPWTWSMAGDWVLTLLITLPDGQTVERDLPPISITEAHP